MAVPHAAARRLSFGMTIRASARQLVFRAPRCGIWRGIARDLGRECAGFPIDCGFLPRIESTFVRLIRVIRDEARAQRANARAAARTTAAIVAPSAPRGSTEPP